MGRTGRGLASRVAVRLFNRARTGMERYASEAFDTARRGRAHFERVEQTPYRVTVTGVRGKSTAVRWLNEALVERDFETYAKVTGDHPVSYHDLEATPIERDGITRLYENEREFRKYFPVDAAIVENQGIREYTTRLTNELFDPQVVILTNVRRDHQSTLGETLEDIARVFTRAIPGGTTVVSGDRNRAINDYLRQEFEKTDVEFVVAAPPPESPFVDVLGAMMNDIESTELLRQFLVDRLDTREQSVTPFVYTRRDRAGRTAAFVHYLDWLAQNDLVGRIHVGGTQARLLERRVDAPTVHHDRTEPPDAVLDACLADDHPVYLMGNTVAEFMRGLTAEIDRRTLE